jgi:hypothetical protein
MSKAFVESVSVPESEHWIASRCDVFTDGDGSFITIETDSYEGSAMMTLPCAVKVRAALGRAIKVAKQEHAARTNRRRS